MKQFTVLLTGVLLGGVCSYVYFNIVSGYNKLEYRKREMETKCVYSHFLSNNDLVQIPQEVIAEEADILNGVSKVNISNVNLLKSIETVQRERNYIKQKACQVTAETDDETLLEQDPSYYPTHDFYSSNYKLSVCHTQQCEPTSWCNAFLVMEDYFAANDSLTDDKFGENATDFGKERVTLGAVEDRHVARQSWEESYKVIVVQHPFSRLLAVYRERLMSTSKGLTRFYEKMSKRMNRHYRSLRYNLEDRNNTSDKFATFEDFLNFVLFDKNPINELWKPFYLICDPCLSNYDYIAKFETLSNDMNYLKDRLNISDYHRKAFFSQKVFNYNPEKIKLEFKQISRTKAIMLYEWFKPDFEMFGYERPSWLN